MALVPRVVARNWRLKLASFALTVVLLAIVRSESGGQGNLFTVAVQAQVGDLDWTLVGEPDPPTVQVRFRGPTDDLIRLAREGTSLRVPLDSVSGADTLVQLRRDWVVVPAESRLVVEDIVPAAVRVALEKTVTRVVPVRVTTAGELPSGVALAAPIGLNPQTVSVRGSAERVRGFSAVLLESIDLSGIGSSGTYSVDVDTTGLGGLSLSPAAVNLAFRVEPTFQRELVGVPVVAGTALDGASVSDSVTIEPASILVRIEGARTVVTGTRGEEVQAVVPFEAMAGMEPGQERRVPIRLRGLPSLVRGFAEVDSVIVRRSSGLRGTGAATALP